MQWAPSHSIGEAAASLRARVQLRMGGQEIRMEVITQAQPNELVVVGIAQFGVRLFAVHQRDVELEVQDASTRELRQIALWVMDALRRVYWIHPQGKTDLESWEWAGERVTQTREGGILRREFSLPESDAATGRVTIEYSDPNAEELASAVAIRNPWRGYEAVIVPIRKLSIRER